MYLSLLLLLPSSLAFCQSGNASAAPIQQSGIQAEGLPRMMSNSQPDERKQELDADAIALSKIPADPLIQPDPAAPIFWPVNAVADRSIHSLQLKFGATYTFLNNMRRHPPTGRGMINSAGGLISLVHGLSTIMKVPRDPSACLFAPEPTLE
jgi:porin